MKAPLELGGNSTTIIYLDFRDFQIFGFRQEWKVFWIF
jgi:hypothetical protein